MQFFPPLTPRSQPTLGSLVVSHYHHQNPSRPASHSHLEFSSFLSREPRRGRSDEDGGRRRKRRKRATGNVDSGEGPGRLEVAGGPRGKGMQDIAAPRDTRGRNLYDGAGDVLQSRAVLQPRSHSVPMYEWPILLGLSLGKSLSIPITVFPLARTPLAPLAPQTGTRDESISSEFLPPHSSRSFTYLSTYLYARVCGTKISFFTGAGDQDDGLRSRAAEKCFLRCRFLSL